jgi:hypothetical protein
MSCAVCMKNFNNVSNRLMLLKPCQHKLCTGCLNSIALSDLSCPICHSSVLNAQPIQTVDNELINKKSYNDSITSTGSFTTSSLSDNHSLGSFSSSHSINENETIINRIDAKFLSHGKSLQPSLVKPGRVFLLESLFLKESKKQPKLRHFFLFNDILMYAKKCAIYSNKLTSQHILSLVGMQIKPFVSADSYIYNGFFIMTPQKSFAVYANSAREKNEWITRLTEYINSAQPDVNKHVVIGQSEYLAPLFIPFAKVSNCMVCKHKFNVLFRKHHCKKCGHVVCDECSKFRYILKQMSADEPKRVCATCSEMIRSVKMPLDQTKEINEDKYDEFYEYSVKL